MSRNYLALDDQIYNYLLATSLREADVAARLREETGRHPHGGLQISPNQGQFMALLLQLMGAKKTLEIGVFAGYSALVTALALPDDGKVVACDISAEWTNIGRPYWAEAGVAHKIDLRLAPALETLEALIADGQSGTFDFAFIDADKTNYDHYYERCLQLVRKGGLIVFDNTLWYGKVADENIQDDDTVALRALNKKLHGDERIGLSQIPVGDGVTLAIPR